ncbi:hypothetical protein ACO0M4_24765 [Streptomyces sp. RGM 3693]|uniref:hypothetical protein n=1 Tax=Streptomyces sp. RGM 3693 TaxID=3413284 RepID=UPI003D2956F9
MSGFIVLRVRAHRVLLAAALLTVVLTATVLATLAAFSDAAGDAGLRQALRARPRVLTSVQAGETPTAAAAALQIRAQLPSSGRQSADQAVERGARRAFDGLPFTVRTLTRSGPYALPRTFRPPTGDTTGGEEPDLTHLAALDRSRLDYRRNVVGFVWQQTARNLLPYLTANFAAFRTANEELGTTIVIVTHDQKVADEVRRTVAIRDGRTSSEVLRRMEIDATTGQESVVAREYATLDRAGRLQLPADCTAPLGMQDRVLLQREPDHIGVWPDAPPPPPASSPSDD